MNSLKKFVLKKVIKHRVKGGQKKFRKFSGDVQKKMGNIISLEKASGRK
jgi:hypothetical protein